MRLRRAFGAQGIVQLGMAFGIDPARQKVGEVLVSTALVPYDNRIVEADPDRAGAYRCDYSPANRAPARPALVELFRREQKRGGHPFAVSLGAMLSGAAIIRSSVFRNELLHGVPSGEDPIIGGEIEGVELLAASVASDDPVWCIVKGISDFADGSQEGEFRSNRAIACRNSAEFVLSALANDIRM